jgi:TonB family protein
MRKPILRKPAVALLAFALLLCMVAPSAWAGDRKVQHRVAPDYPELAKRMNVRGTVWVETKVAPDGHVTAVRVMRGNSLLTPAAKASVRKWKFAPGPRATSERVVVEFKLTDSTISHDSASDLAAAWLPLPR